LVRPSSAITRVSMANAGSARREARTAGSTR
jgi:hypothetical protein